MTDYVAYLWRAKIVRPELSELMRIERNGLNGRETFHDSMLKSFRHYFLSDGKAVVEIELESAHGDRLFKMEYKSVSDFSMSALVLPLELAVHEIEVSEFHIIHRLSFSDGSEWSINCQDLFFEEVFIK